MHRIVILSQAAHEVKMAGHKTFEITDREFKVGDTVQYWRPLYAAGAYKNNQRVFKITSVSSLDYPGLFVYHEEEI